MTFRYLRPIVLVSLSLLIFACEIEAVDPQLYYQKALQYRDKGDLNSAIISLKNAIQTDRNFTDARFMLGQIYIETGNGVSAQKEIETVIRQKGNSEKLEVALIKSLFLQYKIDEIISRAEVPIQYSTAAKTELNLAYSEAFIGVGDIKEAKKLYLAAFALSPELKEVQLTQIKILILEGKLSNARIQIEKLLDSQPEYVPAWFVRAQLFLHNGELSEAENAFKIVTKKTDDRWITPMRFEASIGIIQVQIMQNKLVEAKVNIDKLKVRLSKHPLVKYMSALVSYQNKSYENARADLLEVVALIPDHLPSQLLLGASFYALGDYEQADNYLSRFVNKVPSHIHARKLLANIRIKQNRPVEAIDILSPYVDEKTSDQQLLAMIGKASLASGAVAKGTSYLQRALRVAPDDSVIRKELANVYFKQGAFDQAITELNALSKGREGQKEALLILAYLQKREISMARKLARELVTKLKTPMAYTLAGGVELIDGARIAAESFFTQALELDANFVPALVYQAQLALEDNDLTKAQLLFERVLIIAPGQLAALLGMAQLADSRQEKGEAVSWVKKALETNPKALQPNQILILYYLTKEQKSMALDVANQYVKVTQNSPEALILLGRVQLDIGETESALKTIKTLVNVRPNDVNSYVALANVQARLNDVDSARQSLQKAISIQPKNIAVNVSLAKLEMKTKNYSDATKIAKFLLKENNTSAIGYILSGDIDIAQGRVVEAIVWYKKGMKVQKNVPLLLKLVEAYTRLGQEKIAISVLQSWLTQNPNDSTLGFVLAQLHQRSGNLPAAIKMLETALVKEPNNANGINNLAWIYYLTDNNKALETAKRAYELKPKAAAIIDTYGWIMLNRSGDKKLALNLLEQALVQMGNNVEVQYHVAEALYQNDRKTDAKDLLKKVVASGVEFPDLKLAKRLLENL